MIKSVMKVPCQARIYWQSEGFERARNVESEKSRRQHRLAMSLGVRSRCGIKAGY